MNILIYTQVGSMGGSLRLLTNLAKHLAQNHKVAVIAPHLDLNNEPGIDKYPDLTWINLKKNSILPDQFDIALCHLPYKMDEFSRKIKCRKILVVFEIISRHPIKLEVSDTQSFEKAIYLHYEQLPGLQNLFNEEDCILLPIINDIDFILPFRKTKFSASVGHGGHKHNLHLILKILRKNKVIEKHIAFGSFIPPVDKLSLADRQFFQHVTRTGRLCFTDQEWNLRNLFSSFDCLIHTPDSGNGTSLVISDALACGKEVAISPIKAYIEAYSNLSGVHFIDETNINLSGIISNYVERRAKQIRDDYYQAYNRKEVLEQWTKVLFQA